MHLFQKLGNGKRGCVEMKKVLKSIVSFFKSIFGKDIEVSIENHNKYSINKNKNCDISINENGGNNETK